MLKSLHRLRILRVHRKDHLLQGLHFHFEVVVFLKKFKILHFNPFYSEVLSGLLRLILLPLLSGSLPILD